MASTPVHPSPKARTLRAMARVGRSSGQSSRSRRGAPRTRTTTSRSRARANPNNRAPGTRNLSTREYGMATTASWKTARYAYPRGVGADRGKRPSYPIYPKARARAARTYAARSNTAGTLRHVDHAIRQRYGSIAAIYGRRGGRGT